MGSTTGGTGAGNGCSLVELTSALIDECNQGPQQVNDCGFAFPDIDNTQWEATRECLLAAAELADPFIGTLMTAAVDFFPGEGYVGGPETCGLWQYVQMAGGFKGPGSISRRPCQALAVIENCETGEALDTCIECVEPGPEEFVCDPLAR